MRHLNLFETLEQFGGMGFFLRRAMHDVRWPVAGASKGE
jgi:hypothetical protein